MASLSTDADNTLTWGSRRGRSGREGVLSIKSALAAAAPRVGGCFVAASVKKPGLPARAPAERAERREEVLQQRYDAVVATAKAELAASKAAHFSAVVKLQAELAQKSKQLAAQGPQSSPKVS
jgi:hypothetical protein